MSLMLEIPAFGDWYNSRECPHADQRINSSSQKLGALDVSFLLALVCPSSPIAFSCQKILSTPRKEYADGSTELYFPALDRLKNAFIFLCIKCRRIKSRKSVMFFILLSLVLAFFGDGFDATGKSGSISHR